MTRKKRPSAVEVSPNRREIEELILEGKSDRFISDWLLSVGEKISYGAIFNYRKNKFNIKEEAVKTYNEKKSKERKKNAVTKVVSDIEALDEIIAEGSKLKLDIDNIMTDVDNGVSEVNIEKLKLDAKRLTIQAVKAKHDITKDEPETKINVTVSVDQRRERLKNKMRNIEAKNDSGGSSRN